MNKCILHQLLRWNWNISYKSIDRYAILAYRDNKMIRWKYYYKNGKEHGKCISYKTDGSIHYKVIYEDGKLFKYE